MIKVSVRYAQEKGGQKLHLVPTPSGDNVLDTALCGKHVKRWRMTINVPLGHACRNCMRVNRQRGRARALELLQAALKGDGE